MSYDSKYRVFLRGERRNGLIMIYKDIHIIFFGGWFGLLIYIRIICLFLPCLFLYTCFKSRKQEKKKRGGGLEEERKEWKKKEGEPKNG